MWHLGASEKKAPVYDFMAVESFIEVLPLLSCDGPFNCTCSLKDLSRFDWHSDDVDEYE